MSTITPIDPLRRRGLIALGVSGIFSLAATLGLLIFLVPRYVSSKAKAQAESWKSASLLLIINLLIADMLQALSWGLMSFYWLQKGELTPVSRACLLQGFLINWADLASAFFVLSIALGTWWALWMERCINYNKMQFMICMMWLLPLFISVLGPLTMTEYFIPVKSGAWVSPFCHVSYYVLIIHSAGSTKSISESVSSTTICGCSLSSSAWLSFTAASSSISTDSELKSLTSSTTTLCGVQQFRQRKSLASPPSCSCIRPPLLLEHSHYPPAVWSPTHIHHFSLGSTGLLQQCASAVAASSTASSTPQLAEQPSERKKKMAT
jgi:hypothetical protein